MALRASTAVLPTGRQRRQRPRLLIAIAYLVTLSAVQQLLPHAQAAALSFPPGFTAVNWSLVSSEAISAAEAALTAPIGCTCVGSSGASECPFFECKCECDLTAGACDPFCCCDKECTVEQVTVTREQGLCSADSTTADSSPSIEYCATDLTFGKKGADVNALVAESVLCVAVDNNEVAGEYFSVAPEEQMTVANAFLKNPKAYSFGASYTQEEDNAGTEVDLFDMSSTPETKTAYVPGDVIRIYTADKSSTIHAPVLSGFGAAIGSNECWELNPVRFEFTQEPTTCTRKAVALESVCADPVGFLSIAPFVQNVLVAKWPNVSSSSSDKTELLSVEMEVEEFDYETGASTALQSPYPSYFPYPELVSSSSNNTSTSVVTCRGALLSLEYVIYHDSQGHLERVRARITIGNISSAAANDSTLSVAHAAVDVAQTFSMAFQSQTSLSSEVVSLSNGNVQTYQRSGNPGYLLHYPLRVGVLASNSADVAFQGVQVVSEMTGGLQVPGLGDCLDSSGFSDLLTSQTIGFGEDSQTSCSLSLSAKQFESFCTSSEPLISTLQVDFTHIAIFGNSDPFLDSEWLELDYDPPVKSSATFTDAVNPGSIELTCQHVVTAVHFEFLVAGVGSTRSPQHKIVAARAFHSKENWKFWNSAPLRKQTFLLHTTVSFVYVTPTELEQLIPSAPPIWFSIPNDVFYPFMLNDGTSVAKSPRWEVVLLLWIVSVVVLV